MAFGKAKREKVVQRGKAAGTKAIPQVAVQPAQPNAAKPIPSKLEKRAAKHEKFMKRLMLPGDGIGQRSSVFSKPHHPPTSGGSKPKLPPSKSLTDMSDLMSSVADVQFNFPGFSAAASSAASSLKLSNQAFVSAAAIDDAINSVSKKPAIRKANRKKLATQEISQFSAVLSHPEFKANPLSAIREHLQNTYSNQEAQVQEQVQFERSVNKMFKQAHKSVAATASSSSSTSKQKASSKLSSSSSSMIQ